MDALTHVGGSELAYLSSLSVEGEAFYHRVPQQCNEARPRFTGSVAEFVAANPELVHQMRNCAKKCGSCGKSNATILAFCNGCGQDLRDVEEEYTENVCMGFVYGIEHGCRYPLTLSLRAEEPHVLVYDDLLARGSCHLNAIPTDCHLPDWRHLLRHPTRGLQLMRQLDDACWRVVQSQFWDCDAWRGTNLRDGAFTSAEDFRSQIYAGVNAVPSQFQIHLQYIVPPISPVDYHHFLMGRRLVQNRWLPLEYVISSLEALEQSGTDELCEAHTMKMDDIFDAIKRLGGPAYTDMYRQAIQRYNRTHRQCANWRQECFELMVLVRHPSLRPELCGPSADSVSCVGADTPQLTEVRPLGGNDSLTLTALTCQELEKRDKTALQSYGRPYDDAGRPHAKSYYSFARCPGEVASADDWSTGN